MAKIMKETDKAYLLAHNGEETWYPKALTRIVESDGGKWFIAPERIVKSFGAVKIEASPRGGREILFPLDSKARRAVSAYDPCISQAGEIFEDIDPENKAKEDYPEDDLWD